MGKRKDRGGPRKLGSFKNHYSDSVRKNGTALPQHSRAEQQPARLSDRDSELGNTENGRYVSDPDMGEEIIGPQRQRRRISPSGEHASSSLPDYDQPPVNNPCADKLLAFPTSGQPILDTDIKEMLLSLRGAIQQDVQSYMHKTNVAIEGIGVRIDDMENKMEDVADAHNELVDSHFELIEELRQLKLKVSEIEDRSRRNNIKFRGIPETVKNTELQGFLKKNDV